MRTAAIVLTLAFAPFALLACKPGGGNARSHDDPMGIPSAPPIQIANTMGGCDDVEQCERECDAGAADRCRRLGVTYEFGQAGDASKNETLGTAYFDRSCEMGNASGCVSSGQMHEYAHGVPVDLAKATAAYEKACTIGWQVGCANYAIMLEYGRGVPKDLDKARTLYADACKAGAGLACDRLKVLSAHDGG
jgi:hypothetical protein